MIIDFYSGYITKNTFLILLLIQYNPSLIFLALFIKFMKLVIIFQLLSYFSTLLSEQDVAESKFILLAKKLKYVLLFKMYL